MFSCPPNLTSVDHIDLWIHLIEVEQCLDLSFPVKLPEEERNQKFAILQLKHDFDFPVEPPEESQI